MNHELEAFFHVVTRVGGLKLGGDAERGLKRKRMEAKIWYGKLAPWQDFPKAVLDFMEGLSCPLKKLRC